MGLPAEPLPNSPLRLVTESEPWQSYDRVVLLGASNLSRSLATAVAQARHWAGQPGELMLAFGHGRSYGSTCSVFGRRMPGLSNCGLWDDLRRRRHGAVAAVITDIGNDLFYGTTVEQLCQWVVKCSDRLADHGAKAIVTTRLPTFNADRICSWQYTVLRRLLYPKCQLTLPEVRARGEAINAFLEGEAAAGRWKVINPCPTWFGMDPVHFRVGLSDRVWQTIMARWQSGMAEPAGTPKPARSPWQRPREAFFLHTRVPHFRSFWGLDQRAAQPSGRLPCGTWVSVY